MDAAGLALNQPGDLAISLGTSDTVFGVTKDLHPGLEGHVFPNPVDPESYMAMLCYKNGSLTREEIRDRCANGSWKTFGDLLEKTHPYNRGKMGFYYKDFEILPPLPGLLHLVFLVLFGCASRCQRFYFPPMSSLTV
jgi:xylulokinase